ncbi:hypothetical protein BofuT4_uP157010.1 [Botrytis cinerea T4]|uniref:Uncharacterized protein n=1 Tax=Botryotinia fuckeliana (strain T4) TaxID=999810 RepID=G2YUK7_BOTF4|nr:hypothetical protein BofuT4_uP157010.1 [Botrytis cinerea T4]
MYSSPLYLFTFPIQQYLSHLSYLKAKPKLDNHKDRGKGEDEDQDTEMHVHTQIRILRVPLIVRS